MTNDKLRMTNDKLRMTNDKLSMTNDKLSMTNLSAGAKCSPEQGAKRRVEGSG
jgi:hypothetical protein